jgi:hypothetical protein
MRLYLKNLATVHASTWVSLRGLGLVTVYRTGGGDVAFEATWDISTPQGFFVKTIRAMSFSELKEAIGKHNQKAMATNRAK